MMQHFNLFTAFCLTVILGILPTISRIRSVVAAGFAAVVSVILLSFLQVNSANAKTVHGIEINHENCQKVEIMGNLNGDEIWKSNHPEWVKAREFLFECVNTLGY